MKTYLVISILCALLYGGIAGAFFGSTVALVVAAVVFVGSMFGLTLCAGASSGEEVEQ